MLSPDGGGEGADADAFRSRAAETLDSLLSRLYHVLSCVAARKGVSAHVVHRQTPRLSCWQSIRRLMCSEKEARPSAADAYQGTQFPTRWRVCGRGMPQRVTRCDARRPSRPCHADRLYVRPLLLLCRAVPFARAPLPDIVQEPRGRCADGKTPACRKRHKGGGRPRVVAARFLPSTAPWISPTAAGKSGVASAVRLPPSDSANLNWQT